MRGKGKRGVKGAARVRACVAFVFCDERKATEFVMMLFFSASVSLYSRPS